MRHLLSFFLAFLPLTTFAQVGQPCIPQLVISYDAAGNRIQRKEICDISSASTSGETGEGFRVGSGRDLTLPATVTPNPGSVFLIQVFLSCSRVGDWSCAGKTRWIADTRHSLAPAGKYEGVNVYESSELGYGRSSGGITLPGIGITVGEGALEVYPELMQHEFGHILQARIVSIIDFYRIIGKESLVSAANHGINGHNHRLYWTETWANYLSQQHLGSAYIISSNFPIQSFSDSELFWLLYVPYLIK